MKFENTEVWGFEHTIREMRNNFICALRGLKIVYIIIMTIKIFGIVMY